MLESIAIERYEKHLLGKRIVLNGSPEDKERATRVIYRYAFEHILEWTPQEAEEHLTLAIVKSLKLDSLYKYIRFPPDIDPLKDLDYLVCFAYPSRQYDAKKQILRVYRRIMSGEDERFPKKIFDGPRGKEKGAVLLNEYIANNIVVFSMEDLYEQFADMATMNNKFRAAKIYAAARKLYPTPLDFLHNALSEEERDDFLYSFWQYMNVSRSARTELAKSKLVTGN